MKGFLFIAFLDHSCHAFALRYILFKGRTKSIPDRSALLFHGAVLIFFVLLTLPMYTSSLILLAIVSAGLLGTEQGISPSCTYIMFRFPLWEHTVSLGAHKVVVYMLFTGVHWFAFPYIACHLPSSREIDLVDVGHWSSLHSSCFCSTFCHPEILAHCSLFTSTPLMSGIHMEAWGILFLNFCSGEGWLFSPVAAFCLLS